MARVVASEEFNRRFSEVFGTAFDTHDLEARALEGSLAYETPARLQGCAAIAEFYASRADRGPTYLRILRADAWPDLPFLYARMRMSVGIQKTIDEADTERIEESETGYLTCALGLAMASSYQVCAITPNQQMCIYNSSSEMLFAWPPEGEWSEAFIKVCNSLHLPKAVAVGT